MGSYFCLGESLMCAYQGYMCFSILCEYQSHPALEGASFLLEALSVLRLPQCLDFSWLEMSWDQEVDQPECA